MYLYCVPCAFPIVKSFAVERICIFRLDHCLKFIFYNKIRKFINSFIYICVNLLHACRGRQVTHHQTSKLSICFKATRILSFVFVVVVFVDFFGFLENAQLLVYCRHTQSVFSSTRDGSQQQSLLCGSSRLHLK